MTYSIMSFDGHYDREEMPIPAARTDKAAIKKAKEVARQYGIKKYAIIFYRDRDGCRGEIGRSF